MKIERYDIYSITINDFADRHGLVMEVHERQSYAGALRYYAFFKHTEVQSGEGCLRSTFGNGETPEEAIAQYAKEISSCTLVVNARTNERKEIRVPRLYVGKAQAAQTGVLVDWPAKFIAELEEKQHAVECAVDAPDVITRAVMTTAAAIFEGVKNCAKRAAEKE